MSKKTKRPKKPPAKSKAPRAISLTENQKFALCFAILVILVLAYFSPIVFEGKEPPASDILAWRGNAQSIIESRETDDSNPLWANNIFAGMPATMISLKAPFEQPAKYLLDFLTKIIDWIALYYIIAALGMLFLMRSWGCGSFAGMIAALAFIGWAHLPGLLEAGHNTKFRTMMLLPFMVYTFLNLLKKPNLLNAALFTVLFSLGIQARHYQIMFYICLLLAILGIFEFIKFIRQKDWRATGIRTGFLSASIILAIGISTFPVLLVQEYTKHSIRGTSGTENRSGLSYNYATSWSLHPGEMMTFLMPRFYGGDSSERYEGEAVSELKGQNIPAYWGDKLFTSSTDYIGLVSVILAAVAVVFIGRQRAILSLVVVTILALLISFGKHLPIVYNLFFNFVPFFNKFRVPSMILILVQFSIAAMAAFGLEFLLKRSESIEATKLFRTLAILFVFFIVLGLIPFFFKGSFSFVGPGDIARYQPNVIALLKEARYDLMKQDAMRMLLLTITTFGLLVAYLKKWLPKTGFIIAITALLLFDLYGINNRYLQNLVQAKNIEQHFAETATDKFLKKDSSHYRIFPLGNLYQDNRWPYHHQSIGGYHPAKLRVIQDINESCLYKGNAPGFGNESKFPVNWNIVNILNTKYLLAPGLLEHPNLQQVLIDKQNNIVVYENQSHLPRVFSVGEIEIISDTKRRFDRLNDPDFDPSKVAILEKSLPVKIKQANEFKAKINRYEPNFITVDIETDQQTLLILSEIYYPAGWKAFLDNNETEIYKTNHVLRSIVIPKGVHKVEFRFQPKTYIASLRIMGVSIFIVYSLLAIALLGEFRSHQRRKA